MPMNKYRIAISLKYEARNFLKIERQTHEPLGEKENCVKPFVFTGRII